MKIFITGAAGFIGSHLVELMCNAGFEIKAFVHYNSQNRWGWLEESIYKNDIEVVTGDIRDFDSVFRSSKGCDAIFHLAALIGIPYSYVSPKAYIDTNIVGTYNILESAKFHNISHIVTTSTSETYGSAQYIPIDESHPLVGQSPYSATKISADQLAISYQKSFNLPVKIVRPFNTYGPRQTARAIIPTIISQILNNKKKLQIGNLNPTRDLTFVEDTCQGFLSIFESEGLIGEVTNIGMNFEISIGDLIERISSIMDYQFELSVDENRIRPEQSEVTRLYCNNKKLLEKTNWSPKYNLDLGLEKTIEWMRQNIQYYKSEIYNV
ncbi:MAG: GDP-mannose 4,6-dehydratase [Melioribacteraceae bacterium]|nr:GDP-mannose 4,6-dehydratase [Melioribacteraceae bacterium]